MLEAANIGLARSTPGLFSIRRAIRLLRRFNWRWTLAFTRKPPGGERLRLVMYLDCSPEPGGFRAFLPRSASDYAWLRSSSPTRPPHAGRHVPGGRGGGAPAVVRGDPGPDRSAAGGAEPGMMSATGGWD